ncbi:MAG: helix-turn-helix transcriptional regulator [Chloroflexaceae bacterium]
MPPLRPDLVPRPGLFARLDAGLTCKLLLVSAPAGFGKTSLVSAWLRQRNLPAAWLALDVADNDPARFLLYLVTALQQLEPTLGQTVPNLLQASPGLPLESMLGTLINDLATRTAPTILVLEDYHCITTGSIHQALDFLLSYLPPQVHVMIVTRADPPPALARLRACGQMLDIRAGDLCFTREEAMHFLTQTMHLEITPEEVALLEQRIEGWVAGLQLAALSLQHTPDRQQFLREFAGDDRYIVDYLVGEVLQQQPEAVQQFLYQTAILERFNAALCAAVLLMGPDAAAQSQAMVGELERTNLFLVPLDTRRTWYRYHHLFAEVLQGRLQATCPEQIPILHRRASAWYARHGYTSEAIGHALAAADWECAAGLIETVGVTLVQQGALTTLAGWIRALPNAVIQAHTHLGLLAAWVLTLTGQHAAAEQQLLLIERTIPAGSLATEEQALLASIQATLSRLQGDVQRTIQRSRQALDTLPPDALAARGAIAAQLGTAYDLSGDATQAAQSLAVAATVHADTQSRLTTLSILGDLGRFALARGHLQQAHSTLQQALAYVDDPRGEPVLPACVIFVGMGYLLREWNDLPAAEHYLEQGLSLAHQMDNIVVLVIGWLSRACLRQYQGDAEGARLALSRVEELRRRVGALPPLLSGMVTATQVWLWLAQGNREAAYRWAQTNDLPHASIEAGRMVEYLALVRVLLADGRHAEARDLLTRLQPLIEASGRLRYLLEGLAPPGACKAGTGAGSGSTGCADKCSRARRAGRVCAALP